MEGEKKHRGGTVERYGRDSGDVGIEERDGRQHGRVKAPKAEQIAVRMFFECRGALSIHILLYAGLNSHSTYV